MNLYATDILRLRQQPELNAHSLECGTERTNITRGALLSGKKNLVLNNESKMLKV